MKSIKKISVIVLAVILVFAVAATAFAAGDGSITVSNPIGGQTYTAYKIFDVSYNDDKTAYSYTISGNSDWFDVVKSYSKGLTLTASAADNNVYVVEKTNEFSAAEFANILKAAADGKNGTALAAQGDGTVSADGLDLGYYFVSSTSGALCNLTTTDNSATIRDKNDVPFQKLDDKESVELGETVNYEITGAVPDTTGFTTYDYIIEDNMSEGLTFNKDVTVKVGGVDLDTANYKIDYTNNGFTLTIYVKDIQDQVGDAIKVAYTATVNKNAVTVVSKNSATLTYSNDPTNSQNKTTTPAEEETVYSAKIVINKFDKNNTATKLADAKFVLKNADGKYYKYNQDTEEVTWDADVNNATVVTTDTNGAAEFIGLKDGTYSLQETEAPKGYNLLTNDVSVTIDGTNASVDTSCLTATTDVENSTGTTLPETGGMGTSILYIIGGLLVAGAIVLLITKKRMSNTAK